MTGNVDVKNLIPNAPLFSRTGSAQTVTVLSFTLKIWLEMPVARQTNGTVHSTNLSIFYSVLLTRSYYPLVAVCYIQIFGTSYICPYVGHKNLGALGPHPLGTGIMHDPLETRLSHRHGTVPNVVTPGQTVWGQV